MRFRPAVDRSRAPRFDPTAMTRPPHIYASTVRRRRAAWPYVVAALAAAALLAAVLFG
jgi:hypothetical protein